MKSIDRLRTASPVPRNNSGVRRPPLNAVVPGVTSVSDIGGGRARVRRRILISVAAAACVAAAAAAAITLPQLLAAPEPMTDSAYYETFEQLEAASDAIVYGTVTGEQATVFEGTDMIAYTVVVEAATDGVSGEIEVLVPSAGEGNDPTAETEPLQTSEQYVLALTRLNERWQLTSPAGQSAFLVSNGTVDASLDGSIPR